MVKKTKIVRKIEKQVTNCVIYIKKIEKLSKLHTIWRYKMKIVKKVEKSSEKMLKLSKNLNVTSDN
jgi:hypothetical protein